MNDRLATDALKAALSGSESSMPDVQARADHRHIAISRVGVKALRYPVCLRLAGALQASVATWNLDVALPAEQKGAHMSRFVAWLDELHQSGQALGAASLRTLLPGMLERLDSPCGGIEARFPFFIRKAAPVTGVQSLLEYQGCLQARRESADTPVVVTLGIEAPVKSLCPCSKEVSDYGAHNQRSIVGISVRLHAAADMDLADLVQIAEQAASSEIWSLLKRADEKFITEQAYDNPKFVEDLIRDVAAALRTDSRVASFEVDVENFESIHAHSAWARIEQSGSGTGQ